MERERTPWWLECVLVLLASYVLYSAAMGTGLCGWLTGLQLRWLGHSSDKLTMAMAFALLVVPVLVSFVVVGINQRVAAANSEEERTRARHQPVVLPVPSPLRLWLFGALMCLGSCAGWCASETAEDARLAAPPIELDVTGGTAPLSAHDDVKVQLRAHAQHELTVSFENAQQGHAERTSYVPLTSAQWKPGQTVELVGVSAQNEDGEYEDAGFPGERVNPALLVGVLSRDPLPSFVVSALADSGVTLADPYAVLELVGNDYDGRPALANARRRRDVVLFAFLFGLMLLWGGTRARRALRAKN